MELLERFARGDLEAFEILFRQFQSEVYGWIVRIVRDPGVVEDLTVETFRRIYRAHARFDPARHLGAVSMGSPRRASSRRCSSHRRASFLARLV